MPVIQISKIILRKGLSEELPGAPSSLSPLTYTPGLDVAELAFSTDEGRLFIGHSPEAGNVNFDRVDFPYRNVEVLTEAATATFAEMAGRNERAGGSRNFNEATLSPTSGSWAPVVVPRIGDPTYNYRLEFGGGTTAIIDYAAYEDATEKPIKTGRLTVNYFVGEAEPHIMDDGVAYRRLDLIAPDNFNSALSFNLLELRFFITGPTGAEYLSFEYKNRTAGLLHLRFKVSIPEV